MPNWCENQLTVSGCYKNLEKFKKAFMGTIAKWPINERVEKLSEREIEKIKREYETPRYCFNALVPVPEDILESGYSNAGYLWCIENWGTKWEPDMVFVIEEDPEKGDLEYDFTTAWSPPISVFKNASRNFPGLEFTLVYFEPGLAFAGKAICSNGKIDFQEDYGPENPRYREIAMNYFGWDFSDGEL